MDAVVVIALITSLLALGSGALLYRSVLAAPTSSQRANEIADAIKAGAGAFLSRQYRTVALVGRHVTIEGNGCVRAIAFGEPGDIAHK